MNNREASINMVNIIIKTTRRKGKQSLKLSTFLSFLFFLLILSPIALPGQSIHKLLKKGSVSNKEFKVKLNTTVERGKYIIENVKIEGSSKQYRFILDSGSPCVVSSSVANELALEIVASDSITDGFSKTKAEYRTADISLNGVNFINIALASITDFDVGFDYLCDIDGIIGNNLMNKCVWQISKDSIVIANKTESLEDIGNYGGRLIMQGLGNAYPYIYTIFSRSRFTTLIDLGDDATIGINKIILPFLRESEILKGSGKPIRRAFTYISDSTHNRLCKSDLFIIGVDTIRNPIAFVDQESSIGLGMMDYFNLTLDFQKKRFYLFRKPSSYSFQNIRSFGFNIEIDDSNRVFVSYIWDNSAAKTAGIKLGDEIKSVNNINIEEFKEKHEKCDLYSVLIAELKNKDSIDVRMYGTDRSYHMGKKSLFEN